LAKGKKRDKMGVFSVHLLIAHFLSAIFGLPSGAGRSGDFHNVESLWKSVRRLPLFAGVSAKNQVLTCGGVTSEEGL